MNNPTNEPSDFDSEIAAAFEPLASTPAPDLWNRIEASAASDPRSGDNGWRDRRPFIAAAAVVLVVLGGFGAIRTLRTDDPVDVVDEVPTTVVPTTLVTTTPTTAPVTTAAPATPFLENATWVRLDLQTNDFVSNTGQRFAVDDVSFGSVQAVQRLPDRTVAVATGDGVIAFDQTASAPTVLYEGAASALGLTEFGELIAMTDDGPINLQTGEPASELPIENPSTLVGANGFSVQVVPGEFETVESEIGNEVSRVLRPDALRLLLDGEQNNVWQFGGPAEYRVVLDDFNGRYILAHRRPDEPALPPSVHVVIDILRGTTDSFIAIPGTVALAVPDTDDRPSSFSIARLDLCPTMSGSVLLNAPSELVGAASAAFDRTALGVARCDETWLRQVHSDGEWDDTVWENISASLRSVPQRADSGWLFGEGAAATISIGDDGDVAIAFTAGLFELRIAKRDGWIVLAGSIGPETAAGLRSAANAQLGADGRLSDFALSETGAEMEDDLRQAVEEMIGTGFDRSPVLEGLVTPTSVRVISQDAFVTDGELTAPLFDRAGVTVEAQLQSVEPTDVERSTVESLQEFAGGAPLDPNIRWAEEVVVGAGPNEGKRLAPGEMSTRSNWLIENAPYFRGSGEDAFTALAVVANPAMIGGPHNHCASPPTPAPGALAGLRRVSIQPDPDTYDSCLQWRTFDVFFTADGRVAGVTVDWWEP